MNAISEEITKGRRVEMRSVEEKRGLRKTMLDVTEELILAQARLIVCGSGPSYDLHSRTVNELRALLSATPANAPALIVKVDGQVKKMVQALNLIRCGIECMIQEQRDPILKAIDEALR